jgi:D-aminopeptidase
MDTITTNAKPRLRDLGITIGTLSPGEWNAITDVPGVRVGQTTVIHGDGPLSIGHGPARTGVTAIHPHAGSAWEWQVPAAIEILNGAGEMTGRSLVDEYGVLGSPILITNTLSVGEVHRATVDWMVREHPEIGPRGWVAPVVAETYDGHLNDTAGQHVTREHVYAALDSAEGGPVAEGNVGGGTGMILFGVKGGNGTASRVVTVGDERYTVGVFIQGNCGALDDLLVAGVPVGQELGPMLRERRAQYEAQRDHDGSIIIVIATDAPLSDRQLRRLCKRGMLGLSRTGAIAHHGSGDLLLAFSNAPANRVNVQETASVLAARQLLDRYISQLFQATVEATEEAVLNAIIAAETMVGRDENIVYALPHDELCAVMRRYGRLSAG